MAFCSTFHLLYEMYKSELEELKEKLKTDFILIKTYGGFEILLGQGTNTGQ